MVGSNGAGGGGRAAGSGWVSEGAGGAGGVGGGRGATGPMSGRALLWTTDAEGRTGTRSPRMSTQYARAASSARRAIIGRKTNGGFVITSSPPLPPPFTVSATGDAPGLGLALGDADAVGTAEGEGGAGGVGVGAPWRVKLAHGPGAALAHRRCSPGLSPGNGVTTCLNSPLASVVTLVAT